MTITVIAPTSDKEVSEGWIIVFEWSLQIICILMCCYWGHISRRLESLWTLGVTDGRFTRKFRLNFSSALCGELDFDIRSLKA
jgi:hypothetical protein